MPLKQQTEDVKTGSLLNRQAISREVRRDSSGFGHSAVIAAVIAATSASLAVGRTEIT
jgi:hypothetical protein